VSQTLRQLQRAGLVLRAEADGRTGWVADDWDALLDWWLTTYPGPGGITTYWYGLTSPREQAGAVIAALADGERRVAVSGDVAADEIAPWRRPGRAVIYAEIRDGKDGPDLTATGLTPSGPAEATLELIVPADPGVWVAPSPTGAESTLPLADMLQVFWDVRRAPGADSDQALAALLPKLRARGAPALPSSQACEP
jgi:hypothetical protein